MSNMNNKKSVEKVKSVLGDENAEELINIIKNYNNYMKKLKVKVDKLLQPSGLKAAYGLTFKSTNNETDQTLKG